MEGVDVVLVDTAAALAAVHVEPAMQGERMESSDAPKSEDVTETDIVTGKKSLRPRTAGGLAAKPAGPMIPSLEGLVETGDDWDERSPSASDTDEVIDSQVNEGYRLSADGNDMMEDEPADDAPVDIPERTLTPEQRKSQEDELRSNREFATVVDFYEVFEKLLKKQEPVHINKLEEALVVSDGKAPSLLHTVHRDLLAGICPSTKTTDENWVRVLSRRLAQFHSAAPQLNPMQDVKPGHEHATYALASAQERAEMLCALCDMRCDKEDLRNVVDLAQKSEKQQIKILSSSAKRKRKEFSEDDVYVAEDFNRSPYGEDHQERQYWLYDLGPDGGVRLCRETLPEEPDLPDLKPATKGKGKSPAKRRVLGGSEVPHDIEPGDWETVGSTIDEIESFGNVLLSSKKKDDVKLGKQLVEEVVAEVKERHEAEAKRNKAVERQRKQLEMLVESGKSRSLRNRKEVQVKYKFEDTNADIERAIKLSIQDNKAARAEAAAARHAARQARQDAVSAAYHTSTLLNNQNNGTKPASHSASPLSESAHEAVSGSTELSDDSEHPDIDTCPSSSPVPAYQSDAHGVPIARLTAACYAPNERYGHPQPVATAMQRPHPTPMHTNGASIQSSQRWHDAKPSSVLRETAASVSGLTAPPPHAQYGACGSTGQGYGRLQVLPNVCLNGGLAGQSERMGDVQVLPNVCIKGGLAAQSERMGDVQNDVGGVKHTGDGWQRYVGGEQVGVSIGDRERQEQLSCKQNGGFPIDPSSASALLCQLGGSPHLDAVRESRAEACTPTGWGARDGV